MRWPFISRALHCALIGAEQDRVRVLLQEHDYWRTRAERLTDAALARVHAIHQPTMEDRPKPSVGSSPIAAISAAMAVQEIDSRVKKGA